MPKTGLLRMLTIDRMFSVFWFLYCVVIPALAILINPFERILNRIGLPIIPINIGIFFLFTYIVSKTIKFYIGYNDLGYNDLGLFWSIIEIKETTLALLFSIVSVYFLRHNPLKDK